MKILLSLLCVLVNESDSLWSVSHRLSASLSFAARIQLLIQDLCRCMEKFAKHPHFFVDYALSCIIYSVNRALTIQPFKSLHIHLFVSFINLNKVSGSYLCPR